MCGQTLHHAPHCGDVVASEAGLPGVPVDLYSATSTVLASSATDGEGYYETAGLENGDCSVSISTPLGYHSDDETKSIEVRGLPHEVNFELTELEITPQQRSRGYWAHQLHKALQNKSKDYTTDDFAEFAGPINTHFSQNALNPIDLYWGPALNSQTALLMPLMLNVASGKVHQTYEISDDGRTISQLITY